MRLEGSCHCEAVTFSVECQSPVPFMYCYCSVCRKTAGGGGFAVNLGGDASTLQVGGEEYITTFHARLRDGASEDESPAERKFCCRCGSALWVWDPRWPELVHPFASAIDTDLPVAPERVHLMLASKANWVVVPKGSAEKHFDRYPDESLEAWHRRHGLYE